MNLTNIWCEQDGAKEKFNSLLFSTFVDKTHDYFLWGYVKSLVYKPQIVEDLQINKTCFNNKLEMQLRQKVIGNWTSHIHATIRGRGSHLNYVVKDTILDAK